MFVHLLDHTGQAVAGANACLLEHAYCAYEWMPGETIITGTAVGILASVRLGPIVLILECIPSSSLSAFRPWMQPTLSTAVAFCWGWSGGCAKLLSRRLESALGLSWADSHKLPPPRKHRHRYFRVLAPISPLRVQVVARYRQSSNL